MTKKRKGNGQKPNGNDNKPKKEKKLSGFDPKLIPPNPFPGRLIDKERTDGNRARNYEEGLATFERLERVLDRNTPEKDDTCEAMGVKEDERLVCPITGHELAGFDESSFPKDAFPPKPELMVEYLEYSKEVAHTSKPESEGLKKLRGMVEKVIGDGPRYAMNKPWPPANATKTDGKENKD